MTIKIYMSWTKVKNFFFQSLILIFVKGYSYFFNDKDAINGSLYFIEKFINLNDNLTSKTIIIVPRMKELVRVREDKSYKEMFWYKRMLKLAKDSKYNY